MNHLLPWHILHTWDSGVLSQICFALMGLCAARILMRLLVRRITRILSTTAVLALSGLLVSHPVDLSKPVPTGPTGYVGYTFDQP